MERPVGDKFKLNGCVYVVVEDASPVYAHSCGKCAFRDIPCMNIVDVIGECVGGWRKGGESVHFEHFGVDW